MALCLAGWSRLPYFATPRGLTPRMMYRLPLHIIRLAIAAMFLVLLIDLVSNAALFAIVYESFMVLPTTLKQHLTDTEEHVLCDWIEYRSETGCPLSKRVLLRKVEEVIGKKPSRKWYRRVLKRHPHLRLGKPSGLDPKRAQCFNRLTSTFENLGRSWMRRTYHGATSTIWMRKGVSEAEAEECGLLNISFHAIDGPTISCAVPTWSWLQSLNVYARMGQAYYLDLYSLERNFILNGS
ncbi:hypothetical protein PILCRDRAFT_252008 [Piloderma croceum F 1598]|uniref:HTH CENPB-type domain-containing protein n=1 Tax=Piloderma croceum (strain F 1598) TaxID=765440 RepID=A0A0C3BP50_PILCF|nr:hypothetical protein PILCRDRAFT_252008 [Piloderma croceum F 1598]